MAGAVSRYVTEIGESNYSSGAIATTVIEIGGSSSKRRTTLYKYTNMDFLESCITHGIYASKIDAVNDPFESEGVKYPHLYRICCMTNSPKKMLLWSYYTNHRECCVEYDISSIDTTLLRHVDYVDSFSPHANMSLDEVCHSLYRKGKEWKHENEFRAVYYKNNYNASVWNIVGDNIFLKAPVKSVTFGLFAERDLLRYKKALELLIDHNIEGKKCKLKNNKYELEDDRQFDLQIELDKTNEELNSFDRHSHILSVDNNERSLLKSIYKLQGDTDDWIPIEKIISDSGSAAIIQNLVDKKLLMWQYQKNNDSFSFFYHLTDIGKNYI